MVAAPEPEPEPFFEPEPEPEPMPVFDEPEPEPDPEPVLELTRDMVAPMEHVVSPPTTAMGADVLSELARAILDRRDVAVRDGRDLTLEGMVREMLRPILREWLDRNLPYLIERLVKREIDFMINRAERLED